MSSPADLSSLIAPMSLERLLNEHWDNKPLHIEGSPDRFAGIFDRAALDQMLGALPGDIARDGTRVRCYFPHEAWVKGEMGGTRPMVHASPRQVPGFLRGGATVEVLEVHRAHAGVRALLAGVKHELSYAGAATANCFLSTGETGANLHFDPQATFVMQLEGRKRWQLSRQRVLPWPDAAGHVRPDGAIHYTGPRESWEHDVSSVGPDELLEVTLNPGDLLFFPGGTLHATRSVGSDLSFGLHFMFDVVSPWDILADVLRSRLRARPEWRHLPVCSPAGYEGALPGELSRFLRARLAELVAAIGELPADDLNAAWQARIAEGTAAPEIPTGGERSLAPRERIRFRPDAPVTFAAGEEAVRLFVGAKEVVFDEPDLAEFGFRLYGARRGFVAEEATTWSDAPLPWDRVRELLDALVAEGLLQRC